VGFESWENVWGIWRQLTSRDSEAVRRVGALLRALGDAVSNPINWWPHTPSCVPSGVFVSMFESTVSASSSWLWQEVFADEQTTADQNRSSPPLSANVTTWLLINVEESNTTGPQIAIDLSAFSPTVVFLDLYRGVEITPLRASNSSNLAYLPFDVNGLDYSAVLALPGPGVPHAVQAFMSRMQSMTATPLLSYSPQFVAASQQMLLHSDQPSLWNRQHVQDVKRSGKQVYLPSVSNFVFTVQGNM